MNLMERRQRLDRVMAVCADPQRSDHDKRREIDDVLREAELAASRDITLLGAALAAVAGGDVTIPPGTLADVAIGGGFFLEENTATGELRVRLVRSLAAAVQTAASEAAAAPAVQAPAGVVVDAYPAANPAESDGLARVRICDAIKTLLRRHYDGELRGRGFGFFETIAGELLALAVGVRLANEPDPDLPKPHLLALVDELVPRVLHYQTATDQLHDAAPHPEPGEIRKDKPARLM